MEKVGNMLPLFNPPPRPGNLVGIAPPRLDHIFIMAEDVEAATRFFQRGARVPAHRADRRQRRPPARHLDGALAHPARHRHRHRAERRAAPLRVLARRLERGTRGGRPLAYNGVTIDVAPTRHGVTRGYTVYFFDPVGNRNEVFTGGYWVDPDFEPITWTEEEMGRAMFYYAREVNERFFTVHS